MFLFQRTDCLCGINEDGICNAPEEDGNCCAAYLPDGTCCQCGRGKVFQHPPSKKQTWRCYPPQNGECCSDYEQNTERTEYQCCECGAHVMNSRTHCNVKLPNGECCPSYNSDGICCNPTCTCPAYLKGRCCQCGKGKIYPTPVPPKQAYACYPPQNQECCSDYELVNRYVDFRCCECGAHVVEFEMSFWQNQPFITENLQSRCNEKLSTGECCPDYLTDGTCCECGAQVVNGTNSCNAKDGAGHCCTDYLTDGTCCTCGAHERNGAKNCNAELPTGGCCVDYRIDGTCCRLDDYACRLTAHLETTQRPY